MMGTMVAQTGGGAGEEPELTGKTTPGSRSMAVEPWVPEDPAELSGRWTMVRHRRPGRRGGDVGTDDWVEDGEIRGREESRMRVQPESRKLLGRLTLYVAYS
ncbi:hypothetical protein PO909_002716 [Leuciscus waleckii]